MRFQDVRGLMTREEVSRLSSLAYQCPGWAAIVEIGTHTGLSTVHMANAARRGQGAHIVAVDPYPEPRPGSRDDPFGLGPEGVMAEFHGNLTGLGLWDRVTPLRAYSLDVARMWTAPVGLLFVDAVHTRDDVMADYEAWSPRITQGGWLALHDWNGDDYPGVVEAAELILATGLWAVARPVGSLWSARRL